MTQPLWIAGILYAVSDIFDYLDGDLARAQGSGSREGAILDTVLDRYTDFFAIGALIYLTTVLLDRYTDFLIGGLTFLTSDTALLLGLTALLGTLLPSFVGAATAAQGKRSIGSIGDRSVRNRILIVGLLVSQPVWTLGAIAVVGNFAAIHRLIHAVRKE